MKKTIIAHLFLLCLTSVFLNQAFSENLEVTDPVPDGKNSYVIENSAYKLGYAGNYGVPVWSMYKYMAGMSAGTSTTKEEWKADSRVKGYRFSEKDVLNMGKNLVPVQLFPKEHGKSNAENLADSFYTSNLLFMSKQLKEHVWDRITKSFEDLAKQHGSIYIISGPVFEKEALKVRWISNNRMALPSHFYRIALYKEEGRTVCKCYKFLNRIPTDYERNCSLEEFSYNIYQLESDVGIDFFSRETDANFRHEKMQYIDRKGK